MDFGNLGGGGLCVPQGVVRHADLGVAEVELAERGRVARADEFFGIASHDQGRLIEALFGRRRRVGVHVGAGPPGEDVAGAS